jgi:hypothetical protein
MTLRQVILSALLVTGLGLGTACGPAAQPAGPTARNIEKRPSPSTQPARKVRPIAPFAGKSSLPPKSDVFYLIHLQIGTVSVPTGQASGSEELWSYVDEEPVSLHSTVLGLNGLRVGVGRAEAWEDLERTLNALTGQSFRMIQLRVVPGRPAPIEIKRDQPVQTLFIFFPDRTLTGEDYPKGDNLLTLSCTLNPDDPTEVFVTGVPQLRTSKRFTRFVQEKGIPRMVTKPLLFSFNPLTFQLPVDNDDFLIIGPGIMAQRPTSLGHHFLIEERAGIEYETVLIIRPRVFRLKNEDPAAAP